MAAALPFVPAAVSIGSAILGGSSANSAAKSQSSAANQASQDQLKMYAQNRSDQTPWMSVGGGAVNQLGYLMGVNPYMPQTSKQFQLSGGSTGTAPYTMGGGPAMSTGDSALNPIRDSQSVTNNWQPSTQDGAFGSLAKPFSMADYQADPGYAFRLSEGQKALERSQAARGGLLSGGAAKAMDAYSQGQASQEYGNAYNRYNQNQTNIYNRLAGLSGTGQTAAGQLGSQGTQAANNYGEGIMSAGNAKSAGQVGLGSAWSTGLNSIGNAFSGYNNLYGDISSSIASNPNIF